MNHRRLPLLALLSILSCQDEVEDPEVCSSEHVVDDVDATLESHEPGLVTTNPLTPRSAAPR